MPDIMQQFRDLGYIPYNHMLSVITDAKSFNREAMRAAADEITRRQRAGAARKPTEDEEIIASWCEQATLDLVDVLAQRAADGCAPEYIRYPSKDLFFKQKIFEIAEFICSLPVAGFRGEPAPKCRARWTMAPMGPILDIVPVDPRHGWDDIPDWQDEK